MNRCEGFKDAEYLDLRSKETGALRSPELNRRWEVLSTTCSAYLIPVIQKQCLLVRMREGRDAS